MAVWQCVGLLLRAGVSCHSICGRRDEKAFIVFACSFIDFVSFWFLQISLYLTIINCKQVTVDCVYLVIGWTSSIHRTHSCKIVRLMSMFYPS